MKNFKTLLSELNACEAAVEWAGEKTIEQVVAECHRGDWLLWLAQKVGMELKPLTLAKVRCAKTVIHLMKDERSLNALKVAEKFALTDEVTIEDLRSAAADAADAADAKSTVAAANAAAAAAAYAAADAAADAAYAAQTKNRLETANACRIAIGDLLIKLVNEKLTTTK